MKDTMFEKPLGELEQAVLIAVVALRENAYGITVQDEVAKRTGRELSTGAIYSVLSRLEDKSLLESELGDATPERGGRRKRLYRATDSGKEALEAARQFVVNLWRDFAVA
jgi:PadR family transcriptional regulator, regulatory protein PadR